MPTAAAIRIEIERALERRFPAALSPAPHTIYEVYGTGIEAVDGLLGGGLPVGAISELTGPGSSGRTSLAQAFLGQRTREGKACAWVDVNDAFDPESAAANGVRLRQLLWVRCKNRGQADEGTRGQATPAGSERAREQGSKGARELKSRDHGSGIRGQKNREPGSKGARELKGRDQGSGIRDQKNRERGSGVTVHAERHPSEAKAPLDLAASAARLKSCPFKTAHSPQAGYGLRKHDTWARLEQGLRATDLLLQAGGFAAIVLDLGDTAPEQASRIPLATWFRYRQAAERTRCSLIVLGRRAYAQSAAGVVLECEAVRADAAGKNIAGGTVLRGFQFAVRRGRERFAAVEIGTREPGSPTTGLRRWGDRKPPAATWEVDAAWDCERTKASLNLSHLDRGSQVSKSRPGAPTVSPDQAMGQRTGA
jgi:recombination protein RecA